jgi:hypothetical protein
MDPFLDPLLLRKSSSAGNRTRTSVSVGKNSDHYTTEVVNIQAIHYVSYLILNLIFNVSHYDEREFGIWNNLLIFGGRGNYTVSYDWLQQLLLKSAVCEVSAKFLEQ